MTRLEHGSPTSTVDHRLDADLFRLFETQPSVEITDRLTARSRLMLQGSTPQVERRSTLRPGRRGALIGLLAAIFVLGGATGSLQSLYLTLVGPFDDPWHRGEAVNQSQVVDGYRVTIDRAYADATRLALAISVVDELERDGTSQVTVFGTTVTDASGEYEGVGGMSRPDGRFAAVNVAWKTPPLLPLPAGPRQFHVVVPFIGVRADATPPPNADDIGWNPWRRHRGPWTFDFELTVDGGKSITPNAFTEVNGVEVKVNRLIAASNIVRVELQLGGDLPPDAWSAVGSVRHGNRTTRIVFGELDRDGAITVLTDGGFENASGEWTVTIDELVGGESRLAGPWVMTFNAP